MKSPVFDVFLSYAREDLARAQMVATALESQGWSVWWDRRLVAGDTFDRAIEEQIESARVVVVLWSTHSVNSDWVRNEAGTASEREVLVPVLLDDVKQPLEFRRRHAANLTGWTGDVEDGEFQTLLRGMAAKAGGPPAPRAEQPPRATGLSSAPPARTPAIRPDVPHRHDVPALGPRLYGIAAAVVGAVAILLFVLIRGMGSDGSETSQPRDGRSSGRAGAVDRRLDVRTVDAAATAGHHPDTPVQIALDTTTKVRLDANEAFYLRLDSPVRDVDVVMDMRLVDDVITNVVAYLSVLDENGAELDSIFGFNEIDRSARRTGSYSIKQDTRLGFKVLNSSKPADIWVTIRPAGAPGLVPFFGEIVPMELQAGRPSTGRLGSNESVFYRATLARGDYQAILDFTLQRQEPTNITGSLIMYDAAGGNATSLITLNEIDISHRSAARFSVKQDGPVIFRMLSPSRTVDYALRVQSVPAGQ